jgi:hypothetical protein
LSNAFRNQLVCEREERREERGGGGERGERGERGGGEEREGEEERKIGLRSKLDFTEKGPLPADVAKAAEDIWEQIKADAPKYYF